MKNILITGGDGFCGWPTSLLLKSHGHNVVIVDNFKRRNIDLELGVNSITNIKTLSQRLKTTKDIVGHIDFIYCDVSKDYDKLKNIIKEYNIDTIIHFAEQKSAPYSMIDSEHMRYTIDSNINGVSNVLNAIVEVNKDIHLVHLGTMGVYGYKDEFGEIPEGYLDITIKSTGKDTSILFPTDPGSVYHMTKSLDQILFYFYNKNWGLKITDLHQGIVWGTQTEQTKLHTDLVNRFDYDGQWGTVLNRFVAQAAINHPLTVHGTGGQTRAFIHLNDSVNCIRLSVENPPEKNERVRIFNQVTECLTVRDLAKLISDKTGVEIHNQTNPRKERAENGLKVSNNGLLNLGHKAITLNDELLNDVFFLAENYKDNIMKENIIAKVKWDKQ